VAGCGTESHDLALDLKGRRSKRKERGRIQFGPPQLERRSLSAAPRNAPKPQPTARFRKLGKLRFPNFRREADTQQKRWEAKRSRTLPLTQKTGANGKGKGLTVNSFSTVSGNCWRSLGPPRFGKPVRSSP